MPSRAARDGYPRNLEIGALLDAAIESYKEMADHGGKYNIKVTFENHWGLAADPMNIRIMIDAVNHPYCEASPDFCNWEHEYMLVSGLKALAPYSTSNVHAKYWDRWGDKNDVQRSVRVMLAGGFKGTFALEYEAGPLNGVEGAKYLYKEVLAALSRSDTSAVRGSGFRGSGIRGFRGSGVPGFGAGSGSSNEDERACADRDGHRRHAGGGSDCAELPGARGSGSLRPLDARVRERRGRRWRQRRMGA